MVLLNLEHLYEPEVIDASRQWADEIRPGLKSSGETIAKPQMRVDEVSPLDKLEVRMAHFGITDAHRLAELALTGMQLSRRAETEKK
jgi:hypothetical protein